MANSPETTEPSLGRNKKAATQKYPGTNRVGFHKLGPKTFVEKSGIELRVEVVRLTQNFTGWHRRPEICTLTDLLCLREGDV